MYLCFMKVYGFQYLKPVLACIFLLQITFSFGNSIGSILERHFSFENIGSSEINCISEDISGEIILGSEDGLYYYKANEWHRMLADEIPIYAINNNQKGDLIIGGSAAFGFVKRDSSGSQVFLNVSKNLTDSLSFARVKKIVDYSSSNFIHIDNRVISVGNEIIDYGYDDVLFTSSFKGNILIQREGAGLYLYAGNDFKRINGSGVLPNETIVSIIELSDAEQLFFFRNTVFKYDGTDFIELKLPSNLETANISNVVANQEHIYIGTLERGVFYTDKILQDFESIPTDDEVLDLFIDSKGNLWTLTNRRLSVYQIRSAVRLLEINKRSKEAGRYLARNKDLVYFGTEKNLYECNWKEGIEKKNLEFKRTIDGSTPVSSIHTIDGVTFLTNDYGFNAIVDNEAFKVSLTNHDYSKDVLVLPSKEHLLEANSRGLNLYKKPNGKWTHNTELYGVNEGVSELLLDKQGEIWAMGMSSGVLRLKFENETISKQSFKINEIDTIKQYGIFSINGRPILTTSNGIYEFVEDEFVSNVLYNEVLGKENQIQYMYQDAKENIWFSSKTEAGYLKVSDNGIEKKVSKILIPELIPLLSEGKHYIQGIDENLIFYAAEDGFAIVDSRKVQVIPDLSIEIFKVENFDLDNEVLTSTQILENRSSIEVAKDDATFEVSLASNFSLNENLVQYQYAIDNGKWNKWRNNSKIRINLKPGNHIINFRGRIGEDHISKNTLELPIRVTQHWLSAAWLKYVMYGLAGLTLLSLLFLRQRRIQILKKEHEVKISGLESEKAALNQERIELIDKNKILSSQLVTAASGANIIPQLIKYAEREENQDVQKLIKKLLKKLKASDMSQQATIDTDTLLEDPEFTINLKQLYPDLTKKDIKLCKFLRLDLSTKEIAPLLGITVRGVEISRYRLRKKLGLSNEVVLSEFMNKIGNDVH